MKAKTVLEQLFGAAAAIGLSCISTRSAEASRTGDRPVPNVQPALREVVPSGPTRRLRIHLSWGHQSKTARPFRLSFLTHEAAVTELNGALEGLRQRADNLLRVLADQAVTARIGEGKARIGGGSLPASAVASITVDLIPHDMGLEAFATRLRLGSPAVIGYVSGGRCRLDLRTVFPRQDEDMARAIRAALQYHE